MSQAPIPSADVSTLIDRSPWSSYQKLVVVLAALGFLVDGIANHALGLAIPSLMADWQVPREAFASVTAIGLIGLTIGAVFGGMLGDRFGRRRMMIFSTFLFGLMTLGAATAQDVTALFWFRFVDGLGIGALIPNGAALISEFTPGRRRSRAIAVGMVFIAVGGVVSGVVAAPILPAYGWATMFAWLGALPVLVAILFAIALPESPLFLARRPARTEELRKVLRRCGIDLAEARLASAPTAASPATPGWAGVLFNREILPTTIAVWTGFFFCLLAAYSMFSWVPTMLATLGLSLAMTSLGLTALNTGGVTGGVAGGWLIERFGLRRSTLGQTLGAIMTALLLCTLAYGEVSQPPVLFAVLALLGFFIAGMHNSFYTYAAFIYPAEGRATGVGSASAAGRLGAIASSFAGVAALNMGGALGFFALVAAALTASLIAVALIRRPEVEAPSPGVAAAAHASPA